MLPLCRAEGIAVTPWSPLARGFLGGSKSSAGGATVRARTDSYQDTLGLRLRGRTKPPGRACAERGGEARRQAGAKWRWPGF